MESDLISMLTYQGICCWSVYYNIHTRLERPRRPGIHIYQASQHFDEGLLCLRILVHFFDMLLKAVCSRRIIHRRGCAAYVPAISPRLRSFHFCLECSLNYRCRFSVSTTTTMGNDDVTMLQYCKYIAMAARIIVYVLSSASGCSGPFIASSTCRLRCWLLCCHSIWSYTSDCGFRARLRSLLVLLLAPSSLRPHWSDWYGYIRSHHTTILSSGYGYQLYCRKYMFV
jgi:hypothetical protein